MPLAFIYRDIFLVCSDGILEGNSREILVSKRGKIHVSKFKFSDAVSIHGIFFISCAVLLFLFFFPFSIQFFFRLHHIFLFSFFFSFRAQQKKKRFFCCFIFPWGFFHIKSFFLFYFPLKSEIYIFFFLFFNACNFFIWVFRQKRIKSARSVVVSRKGIIRFSTHYLKS